MSVIKWAGGKSKVVPLLQVLLEGCDRYVDLFCGSICIPYTLGIKRAVLSDVNTSLITMYETVKRYPEKLIESLEVFNRVENNTRESYEKFRDEYNELKGKKGVDSIRLSALFIYLNRRSFNGLYRENSKGYYNVPFRKYNTQIYDRNTILSLSRYLNESDIVFYNRSFKDFPIEFFKPGDVVYLDPPYYPIKNQFTQYWSTPFGVEQQEVLRDFCEDLDRNGIRFIQSNSPCKEVEKLYSRFSRFSFSIGRQMRDASIGRVEKEEEQDNEILIWNYEKMIFDT
jgi:DNA adenine methylase